MTVRCEVKQYVQSQITKKLALLAFDFYLIQIQDILLWWQGVVLLNCRGEVKQQVRRQHL